MKNILFDLDGTVTDPFLAITKAVAYSLNSFDIRINGLDELTVFIGPPLDESFQKYYGMNEEKSWQAVEKYREYYSQIGLFENEVYEGMEDFLKSLIDSGKDLYICTSKPYIFAKKIIEHFGLTKYFKGIYGAELDGTRKNKKDVIAYCLQQERLNVDDCLMVGDRKHDVIGAHLNRIQCVGVLYGYGSKEEFENNDCEYIAKNLKELKEVIENV